LISEYPNVIKAVANGKVEKANNISPLNCPKCKESPSKVNLANDKIKQERVSSEKKCDRILRNHNRFDKLISDDQ
jgi:hypothetical protein